PQARPNRSRPSSPAPKPPEDSAGGREPPKRARALRHERRRDHEGGERVLVVGSCATGISEKRKQVTFLVGATGPSKPQPWRWTGAVSRRTSSRCLGADRYARSGLLISKACRRISR